MQPDRTMDSVACVLINRRRRRRRSISFFILFDSFIPFFIWVLLLYFPFFFLFQLYVEFVPFRLPIFRRSCLYFSRWNGGYFSVASLPARCLSAKTRMKGNRNYVNYVNTDQHIDWRKLRRTRRRKKTNSVRLVAINYRKCRVCNTATWK